MVFEQITNKIFKIETITDEYIFMYCLIIASNRDIQLTFDEFINICDEDIELVHNISTFIAKETEKQKLFYKEEGDSKKKN
jgi:hypothetical protein